MHLVVDRLQRFETGALIYPPAVDRRPLNAIGVIVASAEPGGLALISADSVAKSDRFIVETLAGPSPARLKS